jgi:glycerol kinase
MRKQDCILAIDQGTTGTTAVLVNKEGDILRRSYQELTQLYPQPGWVEHDPLEIWGSVRSVVSALDLKSAGAIRAVGITNQRETTIVWDRSTGEPVCNAVVWQCRRTVEICDSLKPRKERFRMKTGLPVDAYFSGTKLKWILENCGRRDWENLAFGTVDTWLIWKLTGGRVHATDYTNASRTLLFNIVKRDWDEELCRLLEVPPELLPEVRRSTDDYGLVTSLPEIKGIPIAGVAGDQQAALFGQACFEPGEIKNTYGTGCFMLLNTGEKPVFSRRGLLTTLAVDAVGEPCFALEGSIFIGGAAIQWLRDELGILDAAADSDAAARAVADNAGVYLVPAFVGLGAPHWNMQARGIITGLTRGSRRNHLIRAALESMAYQTHDVLTVMEQEAGVKVQELAVDGGAVANGFLLQFQADILAKKVVLPRSIESTSLGAAFLAGLQVGFWNDSADLRGIRRLDKEFEPRMDEAVRRQLLDGWAKALRQTVTE